VVSLQPLLSSPALEFDVLSFFSFILSEIEGIRVRGAEGTCGMLVGILFPLCLPSSLFFFSLNFLDLFGSVSFSGYGD